MLARLFPYRPRPITAAAAELAIVRPSIQRLDLTVCCAAIWRHVLANRHCAPAIRAKCQAIIDQLVREMSRGSPFSIWPAGHRQFAEHVIAGEPFEIFRSITNIGDLQIRVFKTEKRRFSPTIARIRVHRKGRVETERCDPAFGPQPYPRAFSDLFSRRHFALLIDKTSAPGLRDMAAEIVAPIVSTACRTGSLARCA